MLHYKEGDCKMNQIQSNMYDFKKEFLNLLGIDYDEKGYFLQSNGDTFEKKVSTESREPMGIVGSISSKSSIFLLPEEKIELRSHSRNIINRSDIDLDIPESMRDIIPTDGIVITKNKEGFIYCFSDEINIGERRIKIEMCPVDEQGVGYGISIKINADSTLELVCGNKKASIEFEDSRAIIEVQTQEENGASGPKKIELTWDNYVEVLHDLLSGIEKEEIKCIFTENEFFEFLCNITTNLLDWKAFNLPEEYEKIVNNSTKVRRFVLNMLESTSMRKFLNDELDNSLNAHSLKKQERQLINASLKKGLSNRITVGSRTKRDRIS